MNSPEIADRATGTLFGQAIGDALGVPYEFRPPIRPGEAQMIGGGLGPYEPGEWSDDTQMMLCIAQVAATHADLTTEDALDEIANAFVEWKARGASDIGIHTSRVLDQSSRSEDGARATRMARIAAELAAGSASNGGLMRTSVVGLCGLGSAAETAASARAVCALTHAAPECVESAVLWSLAIRHAVLTGELDVRVGLAHLPERRQDFWLSLIETAEQREPQTFTPNGGTVAAFGAAWSAIQATRNLQGAERMWAALQLAISIGDDTDTVAAIAGGLLGAATGASSMPSEWLDPLHGWPGLRSGDLRHLANKILEVRVDNAKGKEQ